MEGNNTPAEERRTRIGLTIVENLKTGKIEITNPTVECFGDEVSISARIIGRVITKVAEVQTEINAGR